MKTLVLNLLKSAGLKLGGIAGWFLGLLLDYVLSKGKELYEEKKAEYDLKKLDKKLYEEYQAAVLAGGNLSRAQRRDLALRLLNRTP